MVLKKFSVLNDKKVRNFILLQIFFNGMVSILTLFVNVFLMKSFGNSSNEVLYYNLILAVAQPIAMITSFAISKKRSFLFTQRMGFLFYGVVLVVLCIFSEKVSFLYPLFAVFISFGAGYYYGVYSQQMLTYTTNENRDLINGATSAFCAIVSLVLPLIAGVVISATDEFIGYRVVFGIEALIAFGALFITTRLAHIENNKSKISFITICKKILKDKNGRRIMIAGGLDNCRTATTTFYVTILIYNLIQSEMLVSINSTIGSILGIIGALLYGIFVNKNNRLYAVLSATIIILVPCVILCFSLTPYVLIVFYALYSLCTSFIATPILNTHFKVMESFPEFDGLGVEIHTVREFFVAMGRIIGILMIIIIPQTNIGIAVILSALNLFSLVNIVLLSRINKQIDKK